MRQQRTDTDGCTISVVSADAKLTLIGIMGSPRIGSNTDLLLDQVIEGARAAGAHAEKIVVVRSRIAPCEEDYGCLTDGNCVIRDDMDDIYPKLLGADAVVVASPIFFYGLTSQIKALIDRCQALWIRKHILNRPPPDSARKGAFIGVGATRGERMFEGSILTVKYFFQTIGVEYDDELLVRGVDQIGEVREHPTAMADAFQLGKRLAGK